ncbi:MAG TPA: rod-binding protein [Magnetospirillaceae bacterium]|jgi:Rod binding domain-containing protein
MDAGLSALAGNANLALSSSQQTPTTKIGGTTNLASAKKTAQDFETFFASQVLDQMFSDVKTDGMFGGGHGEEMFRSLLLDQYAKKIGAAGSFGIGAQVLKSMLAQQEVAS